MKNDSNHDIPTADWSQERLTDYALKRLAKFHGLMRRSAVELFHYGHALTLIRDRTKPLNMWVGWQKQHELSRQVVNEAIRLYEAARGDVDALEGLTITEAKVRFGVLKERPRKEATPLASPTAEGRDYPTQAGGSTSTAPPQGTCESFVPDDDGDNLATADNLGTGVDRGTDGDGVGVPPSPPLRAAAEDGSPPPSQVLHKIAFRLEQLVQAGGFVPAPEDHAAIDRAIASLQRLKQGEGALAVAA